VTEKIDTTADLRLQLIKHHYTHSVPSGKSWYFSVDTAIVCFAIPPNPYISRYLLGEPNKVLELSRLWAPDGHEPNLLTHAISKAVGQLRRVARPYEALVSYADPNVGHEGFVYRAASWVPLGQSEEARYYADADGQVVARRKFHSGGRSLTKAEILARGYRELKRPGKLRFAKGLTPRARRAIQELAR
jgi:hypothetical protein